MLPQPGLGNEPLNHNCAYFLRTWAGKIASTEKSHRALAVGRALLWWRGEDVPRKVQLGEQIIARLEEQMKGTDHLDQATDLVRNYLDTVEISFRFNQAAQSARSEVAGTIELLEKTQGALMPNEVDSLQKIFAGLAEAVPAPKYFRVSDRKQINVLSEFSNLVANDVGNLARGTVITKLKLTKTWLEVSSEHLVQNIGRDFPIYAMLRNYLSADYDHRLLVYQKDSASRAVVVAKDDELAAVADGGQNSEEARAHWEKSRVAIDEAVGWTRSYRDRYGIDMERPTLDEIKTLYNESVPARYAAARSFVWNEAYWTAINQIYDLTLTTSVFRSVVGGLINFKELPSFFLNSVRNWASNTQRQTVLASVQQLVESRASDLDKTAELAGLASSKRNGPLFLELFAAYTDINSRMTWRRIKEQATAEGSLYPDLAQMMEAAEKRAIARGPVSINTARWSPSQMTAVTIWIISGTVFTIFKDHDKDDSWWDRLDQYLTGRPRMVPTN